MSENIDAVRDGTGCFMLLCDNCGRWHRDDEAALSESCECGRFKQRMEWLTVQDVLQCTRRKRQLSEDER